MKGERTEPTKRDRTQSQILFAVIIAATLVGCKDSAAQGDGETSDSGRAKEDGAAVADGTPDTGFAGDCDADEAGGCWATCDGGVVDLQHDWQNCGSCGFTCSFLGPPESGSHGICLGIGPDGRGHCGCSDPTDPSKIYPACPTEWPTHGEICTITAADPHHCAAYKSSDPCGIECPDTAPCCLGGSCRWRCDGGYCPGGFCL